jgi:hypothetical protein
MKPYTRIGLVRRHAAEANIQRPPAQQPVQQVFEPSFTGMTKRPRDSDTSNTMAAVAEAGPSSLGSGFTPNGEALLKAPQVGSIKLHKPPASLVFCTRSDVSETFLPTASSRECVYRPFPRLVSFGSTRTCVE